MCGGGGGNPVKSITNTVKKVVNDVVVDPVKNFADDIGHQPLKAIGNLVADVAKAPTKQFTSLIPDPIQPNYNNPGNNSDDSTGNAPTTMTNVTDNAAARRRRLMALRYGFGSTIRTSGLGAVGSPSISAPSATGMKSKLGQ